MWTEVIDINMYTDRLKNLKNRPLIFILTGSLIFKSRSSKKRFLARFLCIFSRQQKCVFYGNLALKTLLFCIHCRDFLFLRLSQSFVLLGPTFHGYLQPWRWRKIVLFTTPKTSLQEWRRFQSTIWIIFLGYISSFRADSKLWKLWPKKNTGLSIPGKNTGKARSKVAKNSRNFYPI